MTIDEISKIGQVIRRNRFHFRSDGIKKLAELFENIAPGFDRSLWFSEITGKPYQPKTRQRCHCKPGVHRDNCPDCEGTGWRIDFAAIRARTSQPDQPPTLKAGAK